MINMRVDDAGEAQAIAYAIARFDPELVRGMTAIAEKIAESMRQNIHGPYSGQHRGTLEEKVRTYVKERRTGTMAVGVRVAGKYAKALDKGFYRNGYVAHGASGGAGPKAMAFKGVVVKRVAGDVRYRGKEYRRKTILDTNRFVEQRIVEVVNNSLARLT